MSTVVVAIVLFSLASQKYLIVRRDQNQSGAGFWEFPGGKVEKNETQEQALQREIQEELNFSIDVSKLEFLSTNQHEYATKSVSISFYRYVIPSELSFILVDHDDLRWCFVDELLNYEMAPADIPVIQQLQKMVVG